MIFLWLANQFYYQYSVHKHKKYTTLSIFKMPMAIHKIHRSHHVRRSIDFILTFSKTTRSRLLFFYKFFADVIWNRNTILILLVFNINTCNTFQCTKEINFARNSVVLNTRKILEGFRSRATIFPWGEQAVVIP